MSKYHGALAIILLLSISFLAHLPLARAAILEVPSVYPTIQAAVTAANPGDTIRVAPDVYRESVTVEKSLIIEGQDKSTTIVDGSGGGFAFWLSADDVTIRGFTVRYCVNSGVMGYYSGGHTIEDNIFLNNAYGVYLTNSPSPSDISNNTFLSNYDLIGIKVAFSNGNTVSHNYISGGQYGIKIDDESQFNTVTNNMIVGTSHGIYVRSSANNNIAQNDIASIVTGIASVSSDFTTIQNNSISECSHGIELYSSTYNTVFANTAAQNGYGFFVAYASGNMINWNTVSNNYWGIRLFESDVNTIIENTFSFNALGIEMISYSTGNTIAWNNMLNNTQQVHQDSTSGANTWNKAAAGTDYGNYWSNYTGEDTNDPPDGVGDTRLPHLGVDYYPLINPWTTIHDLGVIDVATSENEVYQGRMVNITVVVRNEGTVTETFNVTAKYFNRLIGTKKVTNLARLETTTIMFNWDTTFVPPGFSYEISAKAEPVVGETDKFDNTCDHGEVHIKLPGDVDGDYFVGSADAGVLNGAYGTYDGDPLYVPEADFDYDGYIGSADAAMLNGNYGKTY